KTDNAGLRCSGSPCLSKAIAVPWSPLAIRKHDGGDARQRLNNHLQTIRNGNLDRSALWPLAGNALRWREFDVFTVVGVPGQAQRPARALSCLGRKDRRAWQSLRCNRHEGIDMVRLPNFLGAISMIKLVDATWWTIFGHADAASPSNNQHQNRPCIV